MAPSRLETYKTLRLSLLDVSFSTAFGTLFGGAFLVGFVRALHGGDVWLGFLSAIGSLFGVLQIPGAIWGRGFSSYKRYVLPGGLAWRLLYIPIVVLPILAISGETRLLFAALLITIGSASVQLVNPIYTDWLAEIVPASSRGAYFTKRNAISTGVGSVVAIIGGATLDYYRDAHSEGMGLFLIFGLGAACGLISFFYFSQMADQPREKPIRVPLMQGIRASTYPFRDRRYLPVLIYLSVGTFAINIPGPFFAAYALESLKLPFLVITVCGAMQSLGTILFSPMVGFFGDKFGNKPLLVIGGVLVAVNPILWSFARDNSMVWDTVFLLFCHLYFGIGWAIVNPANGNLMLNTAPENDRANYLGAGNAVIAIVAGISPLVGAVVMASFRHFETAGMSYRSLFWISAILRYATLLFLIPVREKGASAVKTTLAQITSSSPRSMRAARRLLNPLTPQQKEATIDRLAKQPSDMAAAGLVDALGDPLPRVRRAAAKAISKLVSPEAQHEAAQAIIEHIQSHPDLVEEETLEALSLLDDLSGVSGAFECLTDLLQSPRGPIKRAAAHAMGRLGSANAADPLCKAVEVGDPDLRRAALQALRVLGDPRSHETIIRALGDPRSSVVTAAAEAVSELKIDDAASRLRELLNEQSWKDSLADSWPLPSLAYALGTVGNRADMPQILKAASAAVTAHGRRTGLLGAAHVLAVEPETYRLLLSFGMERDSALLAAIRPVARRFKDATAIMNEYSQRHETEKGRADAEAARKLAEGLHMSELIPLSQVQVEESFLIAVAYASKQS